MGYQKNSTGDTDWAAITGKPALAELPSWEFWQNTDFQTISGSIFYTFWSVNLLTDEVLRYEIDLIGRRQGTNQIWTAKYINAVVNNAGTLTQIGLSQQFVRENLSNNIVMASGNSGTTHLVQLRNSITQTINWKAKIKLFKTFLP